MGVGRKQSIFRNELIAICLKNKSSPISSFLPKHFCSFSLHYNNTLATENAKSFSFLLCFFFLKNMTYISFFVSSTLSLTLTTRARILKKSNFIVASNNNIYLHTHVVGTNVIILV